MHISLNIEAVLFSETSEHSNAIRRRAQNKAAGSVVFEDKGLRECLDMRGSERRLENCMLGGS